MPNIKSAKKRVKVNATKALQNQMVKNAMRTELKKFDAAVAEGAMLSVRGRGRIQLRKIEGLTRKQRIGVTFFRYE